MRSAVRTHKGTDPVAGPISEHRFAVFATRDEQIGSIVLERRERELCNRSSVTAGRNVKINEQITRIFAQNS
jgi:hypothetical protein